MNELTTFDELKAEISLYAQLTLAIQVADPVGCDKALAVAKDIKGLQKKVEERRKQLVAPLNEQVAKINAYAKSLCEPLVQSETHLKNQLRAWDQILETERQQAIAKLEAERQRKEAEIKALEQQRKAEAKEQSAGETELIRSELFVEASALQAQEQLQVRHTHALEQIAEHKVAGARKVWTFEVVDESQVPREFLALDEKKVKAALAAGSRQIPGLKIFQETRITVRA